MRTALSILAVSLVGAASTAISVQAGEIRGTASPTVSTDKAPARYVVRGQGPRSQTSNTAGAVAIALENLDGNQPPAVPDTPFVMAQENTAFAPNLLVVPVGAQVTFPNRDAFFHNVFSYSPPQSFDLGRYPKGETRTVRFEESGIVRIFCEIHASMYATILVSPSEHYQVVSPGEGFSFSGLPAGKYRLVATDAAGRRARMDVDLKADETTMVSVTLE